MTRRCRPGTEIGPIVSGIHRWDGCSEQSRWCQARTHWVPRDELAVLRQHEIQLEGAETCIPEPLQGAGALERRVQLLAVQAVGAHKHVGTSRQEWWMIARADGAHL
jgi:hypothetical protein